MQDPDRPRQFTHRTQLISLLPTPTPLVLLDRGGKSGVPRPSKTFIKEADPTGPFFLGEQYSMVDIMLTPWLLRGSRSLTISRKASWGFRRRAKEAKMRRCGLGGGNGQRRWRRGRVCRTHCLRGSSIFRRISAMQKIRHSEVSKATRSRRITRGM